MQKIEQTMPVLVPGETVIRKQVYQKYLFTEP